MELGMITEVGRCVMKPTSSKTKILQFVFNGSVMHAEAQGKISLNSQQELKLKLLTVASMAGSSCVSSVSLFLGGIILSMSIMAVQQCILISVCDQPVKLH